MASTARSRRIARQSHLPARVGIGAGTDVGIAAGADAAGHREGCFANGQRRRARKRRQRREAGDVPVGFAGFPTFEGLKPVLAFFLVPFMLAAAIMITGGSWPASILYPVALIMGAYVAYTTLNGLELVIACLLFYLPFSTTHAIPIAPGVNGTNMLMLLGVGGALFQAYKGRGFFVWLPGTTLLYGFGVLSALSGITTLALPGGYQYLLYNELLNYKGWLEQFLFVFVLHCGIRDREMAKRMVIYMALASLALLLYVVPEMFDKMGRSTIEKSRIEGPHRQANNFGGFVAYTLMPPLAIFIVYMNNARTWLVSPCFLLAAKILISTFSRGAYLALALGGITAGYFRGRTFLLFWASLALVLALVFPQFIPDSITTRLQNSADHSPNHNAPVTEDQLDASSRDRLILWRAAARIIIENPLTGLGFKSFPKVKDSYTDVQIFHVSDPHSMYLSLAAEMGLPVLSLFLLILYFSYRMGSTLSRDRSDHFVRAIGIGGVAATTCYMVICIFGSRAVNLEFSAFFWTIFVTMQVLLADPDVLAGRARKPKKRRFPLAARRGRALTVQQQSPVAASGRQVRRTNAFAELKKSRSNGPP